MGNSRRQGTKGKQVAKDGGRPSKKPSVPVIGSPKGKEALVQSGLQFPYVRGQTNGSENTPQQTDHETTSPLSEP
ncbi:hypothetical protein Q3G72_014372 [Acer saccharum]|nr:hypothetical protein Q3G72_014372 [Acer saccharum]